MPSIKDLKKRIGTVKNTQQTTRAMKMVSAAKLRRAQEAILSHRPYARRIGSLISNLTASLDLTSEAAQAEFPLLFKRAVGEADGETKSKTLLVVVTSDRGLCGGFNSNAIKTAQRWIQKNSNLSVELAFVGRKGYEFFKNRKVANAGYYPEAGGKVVFAKAKKVSDVLVERYLNGEFDEIKFVYNEFKNAVTQKVQVEDFLPITSSVGSVSEKQEEPMELRDYIVKPSPKEVLRKLVEKNFAIQVYRVLLESQAGEHGARMSAMENATKNAGEMIKKLTLQFNKQRQASITKELLEIISGSESQKV